MVKNSEKGLKTNRERWVKVSFEKHKGFNFRHQNNFMLLNKVHKFE